MTKVLVNWFLLDRASIGMRVGAADFNPEIDGKHVYFVGMFCSLAVEHAELYTD